MKLKSSSNKKKNVRYFLLVGHMTATMGPMTLTMVKWVGASKQNILQQIYKWQ